MCDESSSFNLRQRGAATLLMALVLITVATMIILFAGNYGVLQIKSITNMNRGEQAFDAAVAGMEYGINYLKVNNSTILANTSGGYLAAFSNSNTANVVLANNSKYTITYSNPIQNNYTLIKITSVGTSDDGSAVRTVSQLVKYGSMVMNAPSMPLTSLGIVSLAGNSEIINNYGSTTIQSAKSVNLSGSSETILNSGTSSTPGHIKSDIQQNSSSLAGVSPSDFFTSYFGVSSATIKSNIANYYSNSSSTNYSSTLNGMTGTSIWIDQAGGTANFNSNTTIGSPTNPVVLIINGPASFSGNVTIYGYLFSVGSNTTNLTGNVTVIGGMSTSDNISATGSIQVIYSPNVLSNLQNNINMRYYAKVPGSWKDF